MRNSGNIFSCSGWILTDYGQKFLAFEVNFSGYLSEREWQSQCLVYAEGTGAEEVNTSFLITLDLR